MALHPLGDLRSGLRQFSALPAFSDRPQWRARTVSGHDVWLAWHAPVVPSGQSDVATSECGAEARTGWQFVDAQGHFHTGWLLAPRYGTTPDSAIDWSVVDCGRRQGEWRADADAWQTWLSWRANQALSGLDVSGLSACPLSSLDEDTAEASLTFVGDAGSQWVLAGSARSLQCIWQALQLQAPDNTSFAALAARYTLALRLCLDIPVLTPRQMAALETGWLIRVESPFDGAVWRLPVTAVSSFHLRRAPFAMRALLSLRVRASEGDKLPEFEWKQFMPPFPLPDDVHPDPLLNDTQASDAIRGRLQCVIGTHTVVLSDLLQIRPGDLLPVSSPGLPHVSLVLGDRTLGTGELVRCGDQLAVQVVEWLAGETCEPVDAADAAVDEGVDGDA